MDDESFSDFTTSVLCRAEETPQLARVHTFTRAQDQQQRHNDNHKNVKYDEVPLWTPIRAPGRREKLLKRYVGPFRVTRCISSTNYEVEPVISLADRRTRS